MDDILQIRVFMHFLERNFFPIALKPCSLCRCWFWTCTQQAISLKSLTHWGQVMHICVSEIITIGSDNGLAPVQCWNIINWTLGNKFQWNCHQNTTIFIQENAFEYVVWKMAVILSQPQCVNKHTVYTIDFGPLFCPIWSLFWTALQLILLVQIF